MVALLLFTASICGIAAAELTRQAKRRRHAKELEVTLDSSY
jgi:hypothetical protein